MIQNAKQLLSLHLNSWYCKVSLSDVLYQHGSLKVFQVDEFSPAIASISIEELAKASFFSRRFSRKYWHLECQRRHERMGERDRSLVIIATSLFNGTDSLSATDESSICKTLLHRGQ